MKTPTTGIRQRRIGGIHRFRMRLAALAVGALAAGQFAQAQVNNDTCGSPVALSSCSPFTMSTANMTSTGDPTPACQSNFGRGVWFTYQPTVSGPITISTCGSSFDTVLQVYTGTCSALTPVICNDDGGPVCSGTNASVTFTGTAGTLYRILAGGFASASGTLVIRVLDTTPPVINCPTNMTLGVDPGTCSRTKVSYSGTATDNCGTGLPVTYNPPAGSTFPVGATTVTATATDGSGNVGTCSFTVTIVDDQPPTILCPPDRVVAATSSQGAQVNFVVAVSDNCDPNPSVISTPPSGSPFPLGTTTVLCVAKDAAGNRSSCTFDVTVVSPDCCRGKAWTLADVSSPGNRYGHAMAYDSARGRVVLFGGNAATGVLGDTWEWNGSSWTLMATTGPSARVFASMAYDSRIGRTVLFGGSPGGSQLLGDTWEWNGVSWQVLRTLTNPGPREATAMAYDSSRSRTVLFGGFTSNSTILGDTWEFDGAQWIPVNGGSAPPPVRYGHVMTYGSAQNQLLLFGGLGQNTTYLADTWQWDGTKWTVLTAKGPGPRALAAMTYNDNCDAAILFGGLVSGTNYLSDTWEWDGSNWTLTGTNNPLARFGHAMAHDSSSGVTVLFGGDSIQGILGDTRLYGTSQAPPQVLSVYAACGSQRVVIAFSKPVDPVSASNPGTYTITCAGKVVNVTKAVLSDDSRIVWLYLDQPLVFNPTGGCCTLIIGVIRDLCGHALRGYQGSLCCTSEPCLRGSAGTEYWLTFPGNYAPDPTNPPAPQLFIAGSAGIFGTVAMPTAPAPFTAPFLIPASGVAVVTLPAAADLGNANDVIQTNGIHVVASQPVSVYGHNHIQYTTDSYLGLSTRAIGQAYLVMAYQNNFTGVPELNGTQFAVAASQDNTTVTIVPSAAVGTHPAGLPFSLTLMQGQTYQLRDTNDAPVDLSGTIVVADQPVAVFGGHQCANIPNTNTFFADYLVEQMPPAEMWGNNFITVPLATRLFGDTFHIMALLNGTTVSVNGAAIPGTLNQGKFFELQLTSACQITSTKPVLVAQFADSSDFDGVPNSDPFMVIVPPTPFYSPSYTIESPTIDFPANYVNLMVPNAAVGGITLDGVALPVGSFSAVGGSGFSSAQVAVAPGPHHLSSAGGQAFGLIAYGWNLYDSYGYPGGTCNATLLQTNRYFCPQTNAVIQAGAGCVAVVPDLTGEIGNSSLALTILQNPPVGTLLGAGTYPLTFTIVDQTGARFICTSSLIVNPVPGAGLTCPANIVTNCSSAQGQYVTFEPLVCNAAYTITSTPPSGSLFPPGVTLVSCVASNAAGNVETCRFTVTVNCVTLGITQAPGSLTISWNGTGTLLKSPALEGPWIPISNAISPYRISISSTQGFFRVQQ